MYYPLHLKFNITKVLKYIISQLSVRIITFSMSSSVYYYLPTSVHYCNRFKIHHYYFYKSMIVSPYSM